MNKIITAMALIFFAIYSWASEIDNAFSDSEIGMYTGKLTIPKGYTVVDGTWRDNFGKAFEEPRVNFAGKYWVGLHRCGAGCRYYSMVDLSNGTENHMLDIFSSTDPPSRTRDGRFVCQ